MWLGFTFPDCPTKCASLHITEQPLRAHKPDSFRMKLNQQKHLRIAHNSLSPPAGIQSPTPDWDSSKQLLPILQQSWWLTFFFQAGTLHHLLPLTHFVVCTKWYDPDRKHQNYTKLLEILRFNISLLISFPSQISNYVFIRNRRLPSH